AVDPRDPNRLFVAVLGHPYGANAERGIFRSTDGGKTFDKVLYRDENTGGIDVVIDPRDPRVVYAALWEQRMGPWENGVFTGPGSGVYKSTDGGTTWKQLTNGLPTAAEKLGRVGLEVCAADPKRLFAIGDAVNGGESWSSWYNQPTAQMFHVNADNAFPYRVCGGQQESGSACVQTRGDDGRVTDREWHPASVEEYGYAVPDPLDPDLVYGGKLSRWDRRTQQVQQVGPKTLRGANFRMIRTQPAVFSPADPHVLFFAANTVWRTSDGAQTWTE